MNLSETLDKHLMNGDYYSFMADITRSHGGNFLQPLKHTTEKLKAEHGEVFGEANADEKPMCSKKTELNTPVPGASGAPLHISNSHRKR